MKKIGILTSGGDCSGLNAVISAVVMAASRLGWEVYGIRNGTEGLTSRPLDYEILTVNNFCNTPWPRISGSYLGSLNKGVKMESLSELSKKFGEGVEMLELDSVIVIGGDGSMNIVGNYCQQAGVKMIGIPKTIDNDTPITETSVGFDSACQVCTDAIDSLENTARSHSRAFILEVMGRDAGHLAIHAAISGNADVCLVPEIPYSIDGIIEKLQEIKTSGRNHAILVVSEGVKTESGEAITSAKNMVGEAINGGIGQYLSSQLNAKCDFLQTRVTVLGHVQRAGQPTTFDRTLAVMFGAKAVELLDIGETNKMVAWVDGEVKVFDVAEVVKQGTTFLDLKSDYVTSAKAIGMYIGVM